MMSASKGVHGRVACLENVLPQGQGGVGVQKQAEEDLYAHHIGRGEGESLLIGAQVVHGEQS